MPIALIMILGGLGVIAYAFMNGASKTPGNNVESSRTVGDGPEIHRGNPWGLPDIDSANQKGTYSRDWDAAFEEASGATEVPFALLKAHAIRESSLNPHAYHYDNPSAGASYGLMQVEWSKNGKYANRLSKYGNYGADQLRDGEVLYDPFVSAFLGASIIRDNLDWLKGNLRDTVNAYNTGKREADYPAPHNYVNDVLRHYSALIGQNVETI